MKKKNNSYSAEFKTKFVMEALAYPDGISVYCRSKGIKENRFYAWKKTMINNASKTFQNESIKEKNQIEKFKNLISKKDKIISFMTEENIELKKKMETFKNETYSC